MPKRKKHRELPPNKRDWLLVALVILIMIIFFIFVFSRFSY